MAIQQFFTEQRSNKIANDNNEYTYKSNITNFELMYSSTLIVKLRLTTTQVLTNKISYLYNLSPGQPLQLPSTGQSRCFCIASNQCLTLWPVGVGGPRLSAGRSTRGRRWSDQRPRVDLEPGARGAPAPAGREPQCLAGPPLEAAARREEVGPREGRAAGALRPGAAGVGQWHEGAPPQDGEGKGQVGVKRWSRMESSIYKIYTLILYVYKCEEMNQRDWAKVLSLIVKLGIDLCLGSSSVCSIGLPA